MKRLLFAALLAGCAGLSLPATAQEPAPPESKPGVTRPADDGKVGVTRPTTAPDAQHGTHGGGSSAPT
jgi:hypothetical protein